MVYSDSDCDFCHWVCDRPFDETVRGFMKEPAPIGAGSFSFEAGFWILDHTPVNPVLQFNGGMFIVDAVDLTADVFCAAYGTVLVFAFGNTAHFFIGIAGVIRFKSMPAMRTFGPADVMPVYNIHLAEF